MDSAGDRAGESSGVRARATRARDGGERVASVVRLALALVGAAAVIAEFGFRVPEGERHVARLVVWGVLAAYAALAWFDAWRGGASPDAARAERWIALAGALVGWWMPGAAACASLLLLMRLWNGYLWVLGKGVNPGLVFVGSFATLIAGGTGLLMLPVATPAHRPIGWVDALFTSTSASCVTGLAVRDTNTEFTRFGQTVILGLIQLGGLGTVLFGAIVAILFGSSLSLRAVHAVSDAAAGGSRPEASVRRLVLFAGSAVLIIEFVGAVALFFGWPDTWEKGPIAFEHWVDRAYHSVFFAVSAFCNAGFATSTNNLQSLRTHWTSHVVIAGLITLGGIGLPVLANLWQIAVARVARARRDIRGPATRLTLHSKLALWTTLWVYLVGAVLIAGSQALQKDVPIVHAMLDGHFMSVSARTAGFDTVAPVEIGMLGRMTLIVSMFIGGSPGSTAGGFKTLGFAVLLLLVWSSVLDRDGIRAFGRSVRVEIISKAATLLVLHAAICLGVAGVLTITEGGRQTPIGAVAPFEMYLFEAVSACSTVGLSLNLSPTLSDAGKLAVISGMFVGRVGSLALLVSLAGIARRARARYAYPSEGVVLS